MRESQPLSQEFWRAHLADPDLARQLRLLASSAGWAEIGGNLIRSGPNGEATGRTKWAAFAPWFPEVQRAAPLRGNIDGKATDAAVEKAILGQSLSTAESRHILAMIDWVRREEKAIPGCHSGDIDPFALVGAATEVRGDLNLKIAAMMTRVLQVDEDLAEHLAVQYPDDQSLLPALEKTLAEHSAAHDQLAALPPAGKADPGQNEGAPGTVRDVALAAPPARPDPPQLLYAPGAPVGASSRPITAYESPYDATEHLLESWDRGDQPLAVTALDARFHNPLYIWAEARTPTPARKIKEARRAGHDAIIYLQSAAKGAQIEILDSARLSYRHAATPLATSEVDANASRRRTAITASAIAVGQHPAQPAALIGSSAGDALELATLAQVFRDPRRETFRLFYLRDGEIVHSTAISSRSGSHTALWPPDQSESAWLEQVEQTISRCAADQVFMLHNHPSGDPTPSRADIEATIAFGERIPQLAGHIIINSKRYAVLDPAGSIAIHRLNMPADPVFIPSRPHPMLGASVATTEDLALLAKSTQREGWVTVCGLNRQFRVRGLMEVSPEEIEQRPVRFRSALRRFAAASASHDVAVCGDLQNLQRSAIEPLLLDGSLVAAVTSDGLDLAAQWQATPVIAARLTGPNYRRKRVAATDPTPSPEPAASPSLGQGPQ